MVATGQTEKFFLTLPDHVATLGITFQLTFLVKWRIHILLVATGKYHKTFKILLQTRKTKILIIFN